MHKCSGLPAFDPVILIAAIACVRSLREGAAPTKFAAYASVDNERKSATRGSRADEGVRPTSGQSLIVEN